MKKQTGIKKCPTMRRNAVFSIARKTVYHGRRRRQAFHQHFVACEQALGEDGKNRRTKGAEECKSKEFGRRIRSRSQEASSKASIMFPFQELFNGVQFG